MENDVDFIGYETRFDSGGWQYVVAIYYDYNTMKRFEVVQD